MITYGETIRGMKNVSPLLTYKFSNLDSKDMAEKYFLDFYEEKNKGIEILVADEAKIDPSDILEYFSDFNYPDTGKLAFTLKVFISTDGLKIREAYEVTSPEENEVLFFIEENQGDWSKQVLFAKIGEKVKSNLYDSTHLSQNEHALEYINKFLSSESKLSFEILKELSDKGYIEEKHTVDYIILKGLGGVFTVFSVPAKIIGWVVGKIGEGLDLLKIPDKFWDDENENYAFTKENILNSLTIDSNGFAKQVIAADTSSINYFIDIYGKANFEKQVSFLASPVAKTAQAYNNFVTQIVENVFAGLEDNPAIIEKIKQDFALLAGLWNGLVDFISSTLQFIGALAQSSFDILNNWQEFLEIIDNITESLKNIDPAEIWEGIKILYEQVKNYFKDADGLNWIRIAYITGYAIAFIGTMFIPVAGWFGKIAKADKLIPDELLILLKTQGANLAKQFKTKTRNAQLRVLQQCAELLEIFAKGKDEIVKFFKQLADDIGKWFLKNSKTYRKINNSVNETDLLKFIKANRIKGKIDILYVIRISNKRRDLAESLLLSLKEVKEGKTIIQLIRYFKINDPPLPASLSNYQTRIWYTWKKMQIEKQIKNIKKLEEKAKKAFALRNEY
ncbi:MAG: hypothetical protein H3C39_02815 [Flavobacteriia bacterium]|nr:hypothetical protein [Flavobacteriia bacterium]